ncbi:MAG: alpha/beta hydrolase [Solobacterium sp.]|jgi:acetyl esterase/lipase|nr:alpha/beta hydrolase [Solobacterium sp.]
MAYEHNRDILKKVVKNKEAIRNVSIHRLPDGTMDIKSNLETWNRLLEQFDQIQLWKNGAPGYDGRDPLQPQPSMIFIPAEDTKHIHGTIMVSHGGGFETCTGCEGFNVAEYFNRMGYNTAILTYRLKPYNRLDALEDIKRAMRVLRSMKDELHISDKIAAMGFSAGAMLSANLATHFDYGNSVSDDRIERCSSRPDACVMGYGAFSDVAFPGNFFLNNPFKDPRRAESVFLSPEECLSSDTPPFFIWQTISDDPRNAMQLGWRLTQHGIPFELHCFPEGVHGLALADGNNDLDMNLPHVAHWAELCTEWLGENGI